MFICIYAYIYMHEYIILQLTIEKMQGTRGANSLDSQKSTYNLTDSPPYPQFLHIPGSNQPWIMKYCSTYLVKKIRL